MRKYILLLIGIIAICIDTTAKYFAELLLTWRSEISIVSDFIQFNLSYNSGVAYHYSTYSWSFLLFLSRRISEKQEIPWHRIYTYSCRSDFSWIWANLRLTCSWLHRSKILCNLEFCGYIYLYWSFSNHTFLCHESKTSIISRPRNFSVHRNMIL